ncbi:hypothetical protein, partial [Fischerella thermalis]|uniref:hypothetical protein n=1 Tax=Fischerella thermalis TaxID=372787 RepID=UPI001CA56B2B
PLPVTHYLLPKRRETLSPREWGETVPPLLIKLRKSTIASHQLSLALATLQRISSKNNLVKVAFNVNN